MINVSEVKKLFDKRGIAGLHGISFKLAKGEVLGLIGPNGSGKTTLLNILRNRITPDSGSVKVDGEINFFPADKEISQGNVQKFLIAAIHLDIDDEKKIQLARDLADTFEFTFQLRQNLSELSSGQLQKVLLAKELINRPSLLLMDEPFAHLDPLSRREILNSLFQHLRQQEISVIWVSHELTESFRYSDRVAVMNFGKFEQMDMPENIIRSPRNLFVAQYVGYRNFIAGSGEILVVPDYSWKEDQNGESYKIISRHAGIQFIEYLLQKEEQIVSWKRKIQDPLLQVNTQVTISPVREESFLIPL